jgi:hypothetical protein
MARLYIPGTDVRRLDGKIAAATSGQSRAQSPPGWPGVESLLISTTYRFYLWAKVWLMRSIWMYLPDTWVRNPLPFPSLHSPFIARCRPVIGTPDSCPTLKELVLP